MPVNTNKPLPPLPCEAAVPNVVCLDIPCIQDAFVHASSDKSLSLKRIMSRKPRGKYLNTAQVMRSYVRRRKRVNRHQMPVIIEEDEEDDDHCACTICLRSETKPASRDLFAESKKLAELLNTLPQIDGHVPKQGKTSRSKRIKRRPIPKSDVTVLHELGICAECRVECELCILDRKRTRALPFWTMSPRRSANLNDIGENLDLVTQPHT